MLTLGMSLWRASSAASVFAPDADLAIDFEAGYAHRNGSAVPLTSALAVARSTWGWASDASGTVSAFATDEPRVSGAGLHLGETVTRAHGAFPAYGSDDGASSSALAPLDFFAPVRVSSQGSLSDCRRSEDTLVATGDLIHWRVRVKAGSSSSCQVRVDLSGVGASTLEGPAAALSTGSTAAGPMTIEGQVNLADGTAEYWGTWSPVSGGAASMGVGPNSTVTGAYVDLYAGQITDGYADWLIGGSSSLSQAADLASLDLTDMDLSNGFMVRLDAELRTTHPMAEYARLYQADGGNDADKLTTYLYRPTPDLRVEQHQGWTNQGMKPLGTVSPGPLEVVTGHGPDFVGGALAGVAITPDGNANYIAPTRFHLAGIGNLFHLPLLVKRVALYAETPTVTRIQEIASG